MAAATAEAPRVSKVKLATRKRRRKRLAERAARLSESTDYLLLKSCGFDCRAREMRHREPPTRSTNGGTRLNKPNAWYQPGDAKKLVTPEESAAWCWWTCLDYAEQDAIADLSAKCSDVTRDGGGTFDEPDPMELLRELRDAPKAQAVEEKRLLTFAGEDVREWGRR